MKKFLTAICAAIAAYVSNLPWLHAEPSDADLERMREAAPAEPQVKPKEARKMLIFSVTRGFRHGSIPFGQASLRIMGEKSGAYEATVSDDLANFEPDRIDDFDVICFLNTTQEVFLPSNDELKDMSDAERKAAEAKSERLKESLLNFVENGGGFVGIHSATDTFYKWPAYGEMIGGYFDGHPWGAGSTVTVQVEEPDSPLAEPFEDTTFSIKDEIYQFRDPYSRENVRVILSLDTEKTNMDVGGIKRKDNDFAVSWVHPWGKGRVYYCSLGHNNEIYWNPDILRYYLNGIQYAAGDLDAPDEPRKP